MNATQPYIPGFEAEQRRTDLSQWYTPKWLAMRLARWAQLRPADSVLEPSAGRGALLAPVLRAERRRVVAYEVDPDNVRALERLRDEHAAWSGWAFELRALDFLAHDRGDERFDVCLANTPFEDGQDCAFAERALACCDRIVGVFSARMLHSDTRRGFWSRVRPTRIAHICLRPSFDTSTDSAERARADKTGGALSDFDVMELVLRKNPRLSVLGAGEVSSCTVEWW